MIFRQDTQESTMEGFPSVIQIYCHRTETMSVDLVFQANFLRRCRVQQDSLDIAPSTSFPREIRDVRIELKHMVSIQGLLSETPFLQHRSEFCFDNDSLSWRFNAGICLHLWQELSVLL